MLGKLLKHEFRGSKRSVGLIVLCAFLASIIGFGLLVLCGHPKLLPSLQGEVMGIVGDIIEIPLTIITILAYIFGFASVVFVLIFVLIRYYKSLFTDEGYLMFTLPVTAHELLWSKIISGAVWLVLAMLSAVSAFVSLMGASYVVLMGFGDFVIIETDVATLLNSLAAYLRDYFASPTVWLDILRVTLLTVVAGIAQLLIYYFAVTLGAMISKKHKVWASIGMYFLINIAINMISFPVDYAVDHLARAINADAAVISYYSSTALFIAVGVAIYFMIINIYKNKINLE